jgi:hypothetical protein
VSAQPKQIRTAAQIAYSNDLFRTVLIPCPWARLVLTSTVAESTDREAILTALREFNFNDVDPENDPRGEHDFGKLTVNGEDYFFKFDYYAPCMNYGADPYFERACVRVLTVMRADEY